MIVVLVILESAYRAIRKRDKEIYRVDSDLQKEIQERRKWEAEFSRRATEIITARGELENKKSEIDGLNIQLEGYYELWGEPSSLRYRVAELAGDLCRFLERKGPKPKIPENANSDARREFISNIILPFSYDISNSYTVHFPQRLVRIRDALAVAGFTDMELNKAIEAQVHYPERIFIMAERLFVIALEMYLKEKSNALALEVPPLKEEIG